MSNAVIPLTGLSYTIVKRPVYKTQVQTVASGRTVRAARWQYPKWELEVQFTNLRDDSHNELNPLLDFFLARQGRLDSFLIEDPKDKAVSGQIFGIGDGLQDTWQLVRSFVPAGFLEPIYAVKNPPAPVIYLDGVPQESGYALDPDTGLLTITPGAGVVLSGDVSYYWRVYFKEDQADFEYFAWKLWNLKQMTLESSKDLP